MPFLSKKDVDNYEHKISTEEANNSNSQANIENNSQVNMLENIINNPGLKHITEKLFWNLDYCHLELCSQINRSSKDILEDPMFWIEKLVQRGLSKKNEKDWRNGIQLIRNNSVMGKHVLAYLKWILTTKRGNLDVPCYNTAIVQEKFRKQIDNEISTLGFSNIDIVRILAPLTTNLNNPHEDGYPKGYTTISRAAYHKKVEIVRILAPLVDNPNAANTVVNDDYDKGETPIHIAIRGHDRDHEGGDAALEMVKCLAVLTDNPNAQIE